MVGNDLPGEVSPWGEPANGFAPPPQAGGTPATPPPPASGLVSKIGSAETQPAAIADNLTERASGLRAVTADEFNALSAMGGVRGLVEAILPGLIFIIVFLISHQLTYAIIASLALAVVTVIARLIQRSSVQQALGGIFGILIGVFWAWRTGDATDFFAFALWQNAAYLVVVLLAQLLAWPAVGVVLELLRFSMSAKEVGAEPVQPAVALGTTISTDASADAAIKQPASTNPFHGFAAWRNDPELMKRYRLATWFWIALFAVRLAVQVPLFLGQSVGWLGLARIIMGVPLWGLTLYLTWAVLHGAHRTP